MRTLSENRPNIRAAVAQVSQGSVPEGGRGQVRGHRLDAGRQRDAHLHLLPQTHEARSLPGRRSAGAGIQDPAILRQRRRR